MLFLSVQKILLVVGLVIVVLLSFIVFYEKDHFQSQSKEEFLEQVKIGQDKFHTPTVNGEKIEANAYLVLPFSKEDAQKGNIKIAEGWLYNFNEYSIHGMEVHTAVDFGAPYGTIIYAPADGYAMSSYYNLFAKDRNKKTITHEGKEIKYGLGLFVRIYIPSNNRFVDLAHLSEINESIPFSESEFDEEEKIWKSTNEKVLVKDIPSNPNWVKVSKGQILGKVGTSGLGWGYEDFQGRPERKITFDPKVSVSWDEPHLHFEEFSQIEKPQEGEEEGQKVAPRDILGIYSFSKNYPNLNQKLDQRFKPLILISKDGTPLFAR